MHKFFILLTANLLFLFPVCAKENQVALITGASRGVGLATAEHLVSNGFIVYGTIRPSNKSSLPVKEHLHFLHVNLTEETSIQAAIQTIIEKEGHIDVLINNAGFALLGPVEGLTTKEIQEQMEVNFFAPIKFIQATLPHMRNQKSGHIINISSPNAFCTPPYGSMYAASKAALESVSESLCIEVQPYNISVSIVEPDLLKTHFALPMGTREIPNNPYQNIIEAIKADTKERLAHPELLSPSQSPEEVAEFLFGVIQDPHPKLRYQTSENVRKYVAPKLLDLTGDLYLEEIKKFNEAEKERLKSKDYTLIQPIPSSE